MKHIFQWLRKNIVNIILLTLLFTGIGLILYPSLSNWYNMRLHAHVVMDYNEEVSTMDQETIDAIWKSAESYNRELAAAGNDWVPGEDKIQRYLEELRFNEEGVIGYLSIQKINLSLPIYHTTGEEVIKKGAGHLAGSSLPVGGKDTHSVLSSHRGLPTAMLFTNLDKLLVGDSFQLNILNHTLSYQVDQIRVVEPTDLRELTIRPDMDLCTLVTCTPYGINSHRLLVRGHRVKNVHGEAKVVADALQIQPVHVAPFIMMFIIAGLLVKFAVIPGKRNF